MSELEIIMVKEVCAALKPPASLTSAVQATLRPTFSRISYHLNELDHKLAEQNTRAASLLCFKTEQRFRPIMNVSGEGIYDGVHLAMRAAALDPAFADLHFLSDNERDIMTYS